MKKLEIKKWESDYVKGTKGCDINASDWLGDWFVGTGYLDGTWWDLICLARNILANPNTKQCAPWYYHPEWGNEDYLKEDCPYIYIYRR